MVEFLLHWFSGFGGFGFVCCCCFFGFWGVFVWLGFLVVFLVGWLVFVYSVWGFLGFVFVLAG